MKQKPKGTEFLLEIGAEEIPSSYLEEGLSALVEGFQHLEGLGGGVTVKGYHTPRRLILHAEGLPVSFVKEEEISGPKKEICYQSDGKPTAALEGFLKRHKATAKEVVEVSGRIVLRRKKTVNIQDFLRDKLPILISSLSFPKVMRWNEGNFHFPRPVRSLLSLYDGKILSFSLGTLRSGNITYGGGPFQKPKTVRDAKSFFAFLKREGILLEERTAFLRKRVEKELRRLGGDPERCDPDLLREVVNLVERPLVFSGSINRDYLKLPKEILIASMAKYQRLFAVQDRRGKLIPHFVACANGSFPVAKVKKNYEHVLNARLKDATFFYQEDMRKPLSQRREGLKLLVYHQKLGTMYDKSERMKKLASHLSQRVGLDEKELSKACLLAKNDLVTEMVKEFPSLQGIVGYYYAKEEGEPEAVSRALWEQYLPKGNDAKLPESPLGAAVSFLDKLDHLIGCFHAAEVPTGSTDPYGLRRAANALFRILLQKRWNFSLTEMVENNFDLFSSSREARSKLYDFLQERLKSSLREKGYRADLVEAVVRDIQNPFRISGKLSSLREMMERQPDDFLAAFKVVERTHNILKPVQLQERQGIGEVKPDLFQDEIEKSLWKIYNSQKESISKLIGEDAWAEATLQYGVSFSEKLHQFFEKVLVNVEDPKVRQNRLAIMKEINELYTKPIADLSKLMMNQ